MKVYRLKVGDSLTIQAPEWLRSVEGDCIGETVTGRIIEINYKRRWLRLSIFARGREVIEMIKIIPESMLPPKIEVPGIGRHEKEVQKSKPGKYVNHL